MSAVAAAVACPYFVLEKVRTGDREVAVSGAARVVTTNSIPHRSNEIDLTAVLSASVRPFPATALE